MAEIIYRKPTHEPKRSDYSTEKEYEKDSKEYERMLVEYVYKTNRDFSHEGADVESKKMEDMRVEYTGEPDLYTLIQSKIYNVLFIVEDEYYCILDEKKEDHLYPIEDFKVIEKGYEV